ncbi:MAG: 9-O-acetylesterase [Phycisphaerales bacterium]|nr:9-O-acetylesterase [Phycisphaerales bacterium]
MPTRLSNRHTTSRLLTCALMFTLATTAGAAVRLPHIFGAGMVVQRDQPIPVWGWADSGETVTIEFADSTVFTTANDTGQWSVTLPPRAAGGPHTLTIRATNTLKLDDVLVGEVWLCSGQSNMEWGLRSSSDPDTTIAAADYPRIRFFRVPHRATPEPQDDVEGEWQICTPENVGTGGGWNVGFSAVAYHYGRILHTELDVPVGLILSAWGGTRIEPWTPSAGLALLPTLGDILTATEQAQSSHLAATRDALAAFEAWLPNARAAVERGAPPAPPPAWPVHPLEQPSGPTALYNGMIHPLVPFALRGVIWYQGESNHPDGMLYRDKMEALIRGWRLVWNQGDFPFYYVQLAPYGLIYTGEQLPRIWEAQMAALALPQTGMAVTVDIGDVHDIHPKNKHDVGHRLALWALANTYGRAELVYSGPLYAGMTAEDGRVRIRFRHTGGGLATRDGAAPSHFEIAGVDRRFVPAQAVLDSDTVVVHSEAVPEPVAVRYAWSQRAEPNLMNREGLPASPFRTDNWPVER